MRLLCKKLNSGRGASILMALVFFLICGFVGAVILGSATANAQKVQDRREDWQAYYAVSSAARLLRDTLQDSECTGWENRITYACGRGSHADAGTHRCTPEEFRGTTGNLLTETAWKVFCSQTKIHQPEGKAPPYMVEFTVQAGEDIPAVDGNLTMDQAYNVTILLWSGPEKRHQMTLAFDASVQPADDTDSGAPTCSHMEGRDEEGNAIWASYTGTTRTVTTAISWSTALISKGGTQRAAGEVPHE